LVIGMPRQAVAEIVFRTGEVVDGAPEFGASEPRVYRLGIERDGLVERRLRLVARAGAELDRAECNARRRGLRSERDRRLDRLDCRRQLTARGPGLRAQDVGVGV